MGQPPVVQHIIVSVWVPASPLLMQLPAGTLGKAQKMAQILGALSPTWVPLFQLLHTFGSEPADGRFSSPLPLPLQLQIIENKILKSIQFLNVNFFLYFHSTLKKPGIRNSIQMSSMGSRDLSTGSIPCCLLECALSGSWKSRESLDSNKKMWQEMKASQAAC